MLTVFRSATGPLAGILYLFIGGAAVRGDTLAERRAAARGGVYQAPTRDEVRKAEALFARTLSGNEESAVLAKAWAALHFDLIAHREDGISFLVLRESADHKTGRGFYVFRRDKTQPIALQAPHAWDDMHTGPIVTSLIVETAATAAAWNTIARANADLAHLPVSYFQAFTTAFAASRADGVVVQLHGFAKKGRKTQAALDCDLVVSGGTKRPAIWVLEAARQLKASVAPSTRIYPSEVKELGGTTNAQSVLLHGTGHEGFLHLEISLELRKRLLVEIKLRAALFEAVQSAYEKERQRKVR